MLVFSTPGLEAAVVVLICDLIVELPAVAVLALVASSAPDSYGSRMATPEHT